MWRQLLCLEVLSRLQLQELHQQLERAKDLLLLAVLNAILARGYGLDCCYCLTGGDQGSAESRKKKGTQGPWRGRQAW